MTHPTYTQQALCRYNLKSLKRIATELGVTPTLDKRAAQTWVNAIITHQSAQLQKVDNQAISQAELDHFIAHQAQTIAPEPLTTVEINFYHHEVYCGKELIAYIAYDHDDLVTQPWLVIVNGKEEFRANTWAKCYRFITWHQNNSQFAIRNSQLVLVQTHKLSNYPIGIWRILIANCEFVIANCFVWWLSMVDSVPHTETVDCEELLDRPFDELTPDEWQRLREYAPVAESRDLVAA